MHQIGIWIILNEDPDICGLYPQEKQQHIEELIPFISVSIDLHLL